MIKMQGDLVLLEMEVPPEKRGLLYIPKIAQRMTQEGRVLAVGPRVSTLAVGDRVIVGRYTIQEQPALGGWVCREDNVLAVLE